MLRMIKLSLKEVNAAVRSERSVLAYDVGGSHVSAAVCREDGYHPSTVASAPHLSSQTCDVFCGASLCDRPGGRHGPHRCIGRGVGRARSGRVRRRCKPDATQAVILLSCEPPPSFRVAFRLAARPGLFFPRAKPYSRVEFSLAGIFRFIGSCSTCGRRGGLV
jgi:hypothetical protein